MRLGTGGTCSSRTARGPQGFKNLFLEREAEGVEKGLGLFVGLGGGDDGDVHTRV